MTLIICSDDDLEGLDVKDDAAMPEGEEVWPPAEVDDLLMGTEGLQPVSLPLGPRSTYVRRQLAAEVN